jgi:hypothetical protein
LILHGGLERFIYFPMKTILVCLTLLLSTLVHASSVKLAWDAPEEGPAPAGYKLHVVRANGVPVTELTVTTTNATVELPVGNFKLTVTSLGSGNWQTNEVTGEVYATELTLESEPSNEVTVSVRPKPALRINPADPVQLSFQDMGLFGQDMVNLMDMVSGSSSHQIKRSYIDWTSLPSVSGYSDFVLDAAEDLN